MTTFYSSTYTYTTSTRTYEFRVKTDYTLTYTDTTCAISFTSTLQMKGNNTGQIFFYPVSYKGQYGTGWKSNSTAGTPSNFFNHSYTNSYYTARVDQANTWQTAKILDSSSNECPASFSGSKTVNRTKTAQAMYLCSDLVMYACINTASPLTNKLTFSNLYADITISAKTSYAVTYNANGGSGAPASQTKYYGTALTLSSTKPTRTGYTFSKWNTASGGTGTNYNPGASYTANAAATLYAQWTANTWYVKYNGNGATSGTMSNSTHTYNTAKNLTANAFSRAHTVTYNHNYSGSSNATATATYSFSKWNTASNGTGTDYANQASVKNLTSTAGGTVNLYARWTSASVTLRTPTRTGHTFGGWYKEAACTNKVGNAGVSYTPTANITLYAKWTANTYTVSYNANGGSGAPSSQTKTYGVNLVLSSTKPTRTGFKFLGWATSSTATTAAYQPGATFSTNATTTLYAVWEATPTISSLTAIRCRSSGTAQDDGTYAKVTAKWSCSQSATAKLYNGTSEVTSGKSGTWSGTSGTATAIVSGIAIASQYTFKFQVTNGSQTTTRSVVVTRAFFTMDFKAGGEGVGILSAAPSSGLAVGKAAEFASTVKTGGDVRVQTSNIDRDGQLPAESQFSTSTFSILDVDGVSLGYVDACRLTDGRIGMRIVPFSDTDMFNAFGVYVDQNGNCSYSVKDGAAFRNAIGAMGAPSAATMNPRLTSLGSAGQLWAVRATCVNLANTTYNGHDTGILVNNDGLVLYDWSDGTGATQWKLDATTDTTTTLSSVITAASGVTISEAQYAVCGKVAQLRFLFKATSSKSGSWTIGTVVSGKRPAIVAYGSITGTFTPYVNMNTAGVIQCYGSPTVGTSYSVGFTYLLP